MLHLPQHPQPAGLHTVHSGSLELHHTTAILSLTDGALIMDASLFHIYSNTPLGRETLFQAIHFCKTLNLTLSIFIPHSKWVFLRCGSETDDLMIEFDNSYLFSPKTAISNAKETIKDKGLRTNWIIPEKDKKKYSPKITGSFEFMCCTRCIKEPLSKLSVGYIDTLVRKIVNTARFPVLIPSLMYRPWKRLAIFYGGSDSSLNALKLGLQISQVSGFKMDIFTQLEDRDNKKFRDSIDCHSLENAIDEVCDNWYEFNSEDFITNIYNVSHDSLVVLGGFHSHIRRNYSSMMEKIQSTLPNNLLAVGPNYSELSIVELG